MTTNQKTSLDPAAAGEQTDANPEQDRAKATRARRMARKADDADKIVVIGGDGAARRSPGSPSKLDQMAALLASPDGASIAEIMAVTGWQAHSVRGAMAGTLRKRGLAIVSERIDGVRRYCTGAKA